MEAIEKRIYKIDTKNQEETLRATTFSKVGRAIALWEAIEKSLRLLSRYWKNQQFDSASKIIAHFWGSNNIFTDCKTNKDIGLKILFIHLNANDNR